MTVAHPAAAVGGLEAVLGHRESCWDTVLGHGHDFPHRKWLVSCDRNALVWYDLCVLTKTRRLIMDTDTWNALRSVLIPYFRRGGTVENVIECARAAHLDVEDEKRREEEEA